MPIPDAEFLDAMRRTIHLVLPEFRNALAPDDANIQAHTKVFIVKTPAGGIPAGTTTTPGQASCEIQQLDSSGNYQGKGVNVDVYNLNTSALAGDEIISCKQEMPTGRLVADSGGGGGGGPTIFEFTLTSPLLTSDDSTSATVTKLWSGSAAGAVTVWNTCNIFADPEGNACGVAISNSEDGGRFQIVQLECDQPAQQEANFQSSLGDSISYAGTATPIPFGRQTDASQGDLVTLEADGSFTFNRATRGGILDITFSAVIDDILGIGNDGEKSIFQIEYDNLGGGGYAPIEVAVAVGHPSFRIPPNDYGLGGTTFGHWTFSTSATTGHKLRMVASTANGNTVSTEFLQSLFKVTEV